MNRDIIHEAIKAAAARGINFDDARKILRDSILKQMSENDVPDVYQFQMNALEELARS
jgi:uncharacterized protein YybS (DUF2232 family)